MLLCCVGKGLVLMLLGVDYVCLVCDCLNDFVCVSFKICVGGVCSSFNLVVFLVFGMYWFVLWLKVFLV